MGVILRISRLRCRLSVMRLGTPIISLLFVRMSLRMILMILNTWKLRSLLARVMRRKVWRLVLILRKRMEITNGKEQNFYPIRRKPRRITGPNALLVMRRRWRMVRIGKQWKFTRLMCRVLWKWKFAPPKKRICTLMANPLLWVLNVLAIVNRLYSRKTWLIVGLSASRLPLCRMKKVEWRKRFLSLHRHRSLIPVTLQRSRMRGRRVCRWITLLVWRLRLLPRTLTFISSTRNSNPLATTRRKPDYFYAASRCIRRGWGPSENSDESVDIAYIAVRFVRKGSGCAAALLAISIIAEFHDFELLNSVTHGKGWNERAFVVSCGKTGEL